MTVISKDSIVIELDIQGQAKVAEAEGLLKKLDAQAGSTKGKFSDMGGAISKVADGAMNKFTRETKELQGALTPMSNAISKLSEQELKKLDAIIGNTTDEFEILGKQVVFLKDNMKKLGIEDKSLSDSLIVAENVAKKFSTTINEGATKTESLRGKLAKAREELVRMEQAGLGGTKAFKDMQLQAGKLQDEIGDVKNAVRALASDTVGLDAGIGAIRGVVAGFTAYQGVLGLVGGENKEFEKTLLKINGAMAVLQGLQEITNLLQADNVVRLVATSAAQNVWNASLAGTNVLLGISTTETVALSGAMRGLQLVIAGTGIGLLVTAIGYLGVQAYKTFGEIQALKGATKEYLKWSEELAESTLKRLQIDKEYSKIRINGLADQQREIDILKEKGTALNIVNSAENKLLETEIAQSKTRLKLISQLPTSQAKIKGLQDERQTLLDLEKERELLNVKYYADVIKIENKLKIDRATFANDNLGIWGNELQQRALIANISYKQDLDSFVGTENQKATYGKLRYAQYQRELEKIRRDIFKRENISLLPTTTEISAQERKNLEAQSSSTAEIMANYLETQIPKNISPSLRATYVKLIHDVLVGEDVQGQIANATAKDTEGVLNSLKKLANDFNNDLDKQNEDKDAKKKERIDLEKQGIQDVFNVEQQISEARLRLIDGEINAQKSKVDRFRELAEFGTAENLQLEEDRLDRLQKAREKEVENNKRLAAIQIAINQAVSASQTVTAITKAFAEGDPLGISAVIKAVLIGATIASSLATVANAFGALPAFKGGTDYVQGAGTETSDSILARLSKGERVVPAHENKELRSIGVISNQDLVRYAKIGRALGDRNDIQPTQGKDYTDALNNLVAENRLMRKKLENLEIHMGISSEGVYGLITSMAERSNKLQKLKD